MWSRGVTEMHAVMPLPTSRVCIHFAGVPLHPGSDPHQNSRPSGEARV